MNHKVLLADDSLTIQKVIKITLANQPYEIIDASSEDELFKKLPSLNPKIVFLDFNLSEKFSGYELTSKIKAISPSSKVLLLLGTFDTVDDAAMAKCGAADKIVKPFDSNKFIALCKQMVASFAEEEIKYPATAATKKPSITANPDDQWTVNHTTEPKFASPKARPATATPNLNALSKEISDWGMSVPGVINDREAKDKVIDLPPVIGEVKQLSAQRKKAEEPKKEEIKFPDNNDLDYPTIEELNQMSEPVSSGKTENPLSKLLSIEAFNDAPMELEIEHNINSMSESNVTNIEAQIKDEVENDLWIADEFEELKREVSAKIEEVKSNFAPSRNDFDDSLFKPIDDAQSVDWSPTERDQSFESNFAAPSSDDMRAQIETMVKKYVQEYMDQMFQKNVEKVTWEVVPDLAENLIRQELSKITNKILNEPNS